MTTDEQLCRDAAMDVMLERAFAGAGPDVAARVLARRNAPEHVRQPHAPRSRPNTALRAALVLLAIGAVFAVSQARRGTHDAVAQDPAAAREDIAVRDAAHLRSLADAVQHATATHVQVVLMDFPAGAVRGQQVDYVEVPEARVPVEDHGELLAHVANAIARPADESWQFPDELLDVRFAIDDRRAVLARCHRVGERFAIHVTGAGFRYVAAAPLAKRLEQLFAATRTARTRSFVFATNAAQLREAPATVRNVLVYGLADDDLVGLARLQAAERVELVARRLDEYPQRYEGVVIGAESVQRLARLPRLRELVLRGAAADDDALSKLAQLPALEQLTVAEGRDRATFTAAGLRALAASRTLVELELSECDALDDAGLRALSTAPALRRVRIDRAAGPTGAGVAALLATPRLVRVELVEIDCDDLFAGAAAAAHDDRPLRLEHLRLERCRCGLQGLVGLPFLRSLSLVGCELSPGSLAAVASSRVADLELRKCAFASEELPALGGASMLTVLRIGQVRGVTDWPAVLAALGRLPRLTDLQLVQCGIADDDLAVLPGFETLRSLDLRHHRIGDERIAALRRRFAGATLRF